MGLSIIEQACAEASELAYGDIRKRLAQYPTLRQLRFRHVPNLSSHDVAVFKANHMVIIAFRGTVVSKVTDLVSDVILAVSSAQLTPRFKRSYNQALTAMHYFGRNLQYYITGHSLGGTLADTVTRRLVHDLPYYRLHGVTFNKGSGIFPSECRQITSTNRKACQSVTHIRMSGDMISYLERRVHKQLSPASKSKSAHSICQFNNTC